jgi:hypothetical protein
VVVRLNIFHDVEAQYVFGALIRFYDKRGAAVVDGELLPDRLELYERRGQWCVLDWDRTWEWKTGRDAQLFVSKELGIAGLLVVRYDSYSWAYELFQHGSVVDRFVQDPPEDAPRAWFPGGGSLGDPASLVACLPELSLLDLSPYLVQRPSYDKDFGTRFHELNVPVRSGDRFRRFDRGAVFDFMRALGVELRIDDEGEVRFGQLFRRFNFRFP